MDPSISWKRGLRPSGAAFSRLPLEKSSSPTTSWPSASSLSARYPPMNPAAPVTQTFAIPLSPAQLGQLLSLSGRQDPGEAAVHPAFGGVEQIAIAKVDLLLPNLLGPLPPRDHRF